jgi:hypothetical protein
MVHGIQFAAIRLIIGTLAVLAQGYLFVHIRRAVWSLPLSGRFKSGAVAIVGLAIVLLFAANRYMMFSPITRAGPPKSAGEVLVYASAVWTLGSIPSALVLLLIHFAGWFCRFARKMSRFDPKIFAHAGSNEPAPPDPARRRFLQAGLKGLAVAPFVFSGYGALFTSRTFEVRELALSFGLPLRVVQLTDIHAGIYMTREEVRQLADRVIALEPDLFVLTGDYISNSMEFLPGCIEEMARVRARYGTFASLGNHENWYGNPAEIRSVFSRYEIPLLVNTRKVIRCRQGAFAVAGIDDLHSGRPDLDAAVRGLGSMPTLLLSHRPEIFPQAAAHGIPLTLSGHYHGGQIKVGNISLATLVTPYPEGLYRLNASQLYVSRGIGTTFTPVRLNVPPEITLLKLRA